MEETQEIGRLFDTLAAGWDDKTDRVTRTRVIAEAIACSVPLQPDMHVLDFGAGTGLLTVLLSSSVAHITALDASSEMLRVLREKAQSSGLLNIQTLQANIETAPLPNTSYDLILSAMVLHHIADVPALLHGLRKTLRPGGWIALADLDAEDGSFHGQASHVFHHGFQRAQLRSWLEASGFVWRSAREVVRMERIGHDGIARAYPIFLVTAQVAD